MINGFTKKYNLICIKANENAGWNFEWDYSESCQFTKYKLKVSIMIGIVIVGINHM